MSGAPAPTPAATTRAPGAASRPLLLSLAAATLLAGCASLGGGGPATVDPGSLDGGALPDDVPVLQVAHGGGFVPVGYDFSSVPQLTVYGDGLVVVPGPQIEPYPAPALPNLLTHQLDAEQLDALLELAADAGLLAAAPSYGTPPVADAGATTVTLVHDGRTWVHAAEALGVLESPDSGMSAEDLGLTAEEAEARQALHDFVGAAQELVAAAPEAGAYEVPAWAVMAAEVGEEALVPAEDGLERQRLAWPVETALPAEMACVVVDGDEAAAVTTALAGANTLTVWEQDGVHHEVWFRPLLPHEDGCPE